MDYYSAIRINVTCHGMDRSPRNYVERRKPHRVYILHVSVYMNVVDVLAHHPDCPQF